MFGMSLDEKQRRMIERYRLIEDTQERLAAVTARGKKWPAPLDGERTDTNLVPGCSSRVWLVGAMSDDVCRFRMDADSPLVKGLAALLCELYDGETPADIAGTEPELFESLGFARTLSPTRLNGVAQIRSVIRNFASRHT
jgi:cysteine desulfuration protein SufE